MNLQYAQIRDLFLEALECDGIDSQLEYVAEHCEDRPELNAELEKMLRAHNDADGFLESRAETTRIIPAISEKPGDEIGPYKLREQIGEGGFGVVYVAEQTEPVTRKVALKIIKPGMDTKDVIARFEAERQALALMDHPNVAKVLDAGSTESGRPYFVMELVKGVSITEFCDEQKLSTRERLELFVDICRAVKHAHQKGIIHRDLKPSNIMVTIRDDRAIPKVIDFGVSKALSRKLTDKTVYTAFGQMIGTPLYMSPEQAQMNEIDVDIRSDVYSLGVLLYELITGTTPFDKKTLQKSGIDEMRRIIREVEPPRPSDRISTLNAELLSTLSDKRQIDPRKIGQSYKGELDWIVMKALEKDRNRRYESASAFAADVNRYLNDEPIEARPPSAVYRLRKFAKRKRGVLTGVSMVVITLLISGIVGSVMVWNERIEAIYQRDVAKEQRIRAEKALKETRATIDKYVETVQNAELLKEPRFKPLMKELLKDALAHYKRFVKEHGHDDSILLDLSKAMFQVAKMSAEFGDSEEAIDAYRQVVEICERLVRENPTVTAYQSDVADSHDKIASVYRDTGKPDQAFVVYQKALEIWKRLVRDNPTVTAYQSDLANSHNNIAWFLATTPDEQIQDPKKAIEHAEKAVELVPEDGNYRNTLGVAHYRVNDMQSAIEALEKSIQLLSGGDPNNWLILAMAEWRLGNKDKAREWYDKSASWMESRKIKDPDLIRFRAEAVEMLGVPVLAPRPESDKKRTPLVAPRPRSGNRNERTGQISVTPSGNAVKHF